MSVSNNISGGPASPQKKCAMKIKEEKKRRARKNYFDGLKEFVWVLRKKIGRDLKDLWGNYS